MGKIMVFIVFVQIFGVSGVTYYESHRYFRLIHFGFLSFYSIFCFFTIVSYWNSVRTCPGFIGKNQENNLNEEDVKAGKSFCELCKCVKEANVKHCYTCERCVVNKSHHCQWINNCVGKYNHKFFLLFLVYSCIWVGFTIGINSRIVYEICREKYDKEQIVPIVLSVYTFIVTIIFFTYCVRVLFDQILTINDKKKYFKSDSRSFCLSLKDIFGKGSKFCWFFPLLFITNDNTSVAPKNSSKYIIEKIENTSFTHQTL